MKISVPKPFRGEPIEDSDMAVFRWQRGAEGDCNWIEDRIDKDFAINEGGISERVVTLCAADSRFLETPYRGSGVYQPLESHPELFRIFGDLDGSEAAFARFATEFGALGVPILTAAARLVEPITIWRIFWSEMRTIGLMLDAVHQSLHLPLLRRSVSTAGGALVVTLKPEDTGAAIELRDTLGSDRLFDVFVWDYVVERSRSEREMLRRCAGFWIQRRMNAWMEGAMFSEVSAPGRIIFSSSEGAWRVRLQPGSLAAAMCVQASRALEGGVQHRQCIQCRKWFVISTDRGLGRRSDAKYCTDPKCRKEAWRKRNATRKRSTR